MRTVDLTVSRKTVQGPIVLEFATEFNSDLFSDCDSQILLTIVHPLPSQEPVHHQAVSESVEGA